MNWSTWNPFKPFGREKAEVVCILEGVIAGTLDCRYWDTFLNVPMRGTPDLEAVRVACEALEDEEIMDASGTITHTESGRNKIQSLLRDLKEGSNRVAGGN